MYLSYETRRNKLVLVASALGYDHPIKLLHKYMDEPIVPGVCIRPGCGFINGVEPNEQHGMCASCESPTVQSVFVLAAVV